LIHKLFETEQNGTAPGQAWFDDGSITAPYRRRRSMFELAVAFIALFSAIIFLAQCD
jgi:hypothetical protein